MFDRVLNMLLNSKIGFIKEVLPKVKENLLIMRDRPLLNTHLISAPFYLSTGSSNKILLTKFTQILLVFDSCYFILFCDKFFSGLLFIYRSMNVSAHDNNTFQSVCSGSQNNRCHE